MEMAFTLISQGYSPFREFPKDGQPRPLTDEDSNHNRVITIF